jgi:Putative auto-transporter adhesin, head GIN domain
LGPVSLQPFADPPQIVVSHTGAGQGLAGTREVVELSGFDRLTDQPLREGLVAIDGFLLHEGDDIPPRRKLRRHRVLHMGGQLLRRALLVLLGAVSTSSCLLGVQGSGNVITESREVSGFEEIVLDGSGRVEVAVSGSESLTIEAEDNIMPLLETQVRDGRLVLGNTRSISPTVDVVYTITAATLDGLDISGSGVVVATGVDGTDFNVDISGSGNVELEGTLSGLLSVSISGSGEFDGESLSSPEGRVDVSGSGNAVVNVTDSLAVSVSGSGDVSYIGQPTVDSAVSGSGNVSQRE